MSTPITVSAVAESEADIVYPDSDGLPMSDNTLQFQWITTIVGGLQSQFRNDPNVFVAGDLLWYPIEGDNKTRIAPDAMVVFGRSKGHRGSYLQWREDGIAPQVVFEVLSPGNRPMEMMRKYEFYKRFDVEEYYLYDPDNVELAGWRRVGRLFEAVPEMNGWVSPRLGIRFDLNGPELTIVGRDGKPFATYVEIATRAEEADARAEEADARAARLAEQLRALGIEPEA